MPYFRRPSHILDLCFTSHPSTVISSQKFPGNSDHEAVIIKFFGHICLPKTSCSNIYLYNKTNWDKIRSSLLHDMKYSLNLTQAL